ncbi:hypothetical protein AWZ03_014362 [Drosophila navojoa]|uniref:Uncharacterized protein n=1 Tax=Drosophila navojoa TaxID=7232 RepID=A0A484ARD3_DRONA|nr:uncharacterized protein LOC115565281 [Drosophila navojoa]TDG39217.1 hypothetical protein AWZ03_014362 [Drosophila navojoa]
MDHKAMAWSNPSLTQGVRTGEVAPDIKAWQRINWPLCRQAGIFKDWASRLRTKQALDYFSRSLSICQTEGQGACCRNSLTALDHHSCYATEGKYCQMAADALAKRSFFRREMAQPELALEDAQKAQDLLAHQGKSRLSNVLNKCDAMFECNQFEENLMQLHIEKRNCQTSTAKHCFEYRATHTTSVLEGSLGDALYPFMLHSWPLVVRLARSRRTPAAFMPRPIWQLSEKRECDVESLGEKEKADYSPLEQAQLRMRKNAYNSQYLRHSARDLGMLKQLQTSLTLPHLQSQISTPYMTELLAEQSAMVHKFMKMSHNRSPLYQCRYEKCRDTKICERNQQEALLRIEYQTRRECFRMLREVRKRRQERNIERLTDYVEHIMSTSLSFKTNRTLPWKWEFINEVYNILALAHIDRCALPKNVDFLDLQNHSILYLLTTERANGQIPAVSFGDRNIYAEADREKARQSRMVKKVERLCSRLKHSRFGIERTYLKFEIARCHLKTSYFDKALIMAQKALLEARNCGSTVWRFNITFLICQVYAILHRFRRLGETLTWASHLAERLKSPKLRAYLALCQAVNDYQLNFAHRHETEHNFRDRRRKQPSYSSIESTDYTGEISY